MLTYIIRTGALYRGAQLLGFCYSGHEECLNDPLATNRKGMGPIPAGAYLIGPVREHSGCGAFVFPLIPLTGTETFGRGDLEMHGDSIEHAGEKVASHGCIIAARAIREGIVANGDRLLVVLPEHLPQKERMAA